MQSLQSVFPFAARILAAAFLFMAPPLQAQWEKIDNPYVLPVQSVNVAGGKMFLSNGAALYRSDDNGLSWTLVPSLIVPSNVFYSDIYTAGDHLYVVFTDIAATNNVRVYRSFDLGQTWEVFVAHSEEPLKKVAAYSGGLLIARNNVLQRVRDNATEVETLPNGSPCCKKALAASGNTAWLGNTQGLYRSIDEGVTWTLVHDGWSVDDLAVLGDTVAVGTSGLLYRSVDGGQNWTVVDSSWLSKDIFTAGGLFFEVSKLDNRVYESADGFATTTVILDEPPFPDHMVKQNGFYVANWGVGVERRYQSSTEWLYSAQGIRPSGAYPLALTAYEDVLLTGDIFYQDGYFGKENGQVWGMDCRHIGMYTMARAGTDYYALSTAEQGLFHSSGNFNHWDKIPLPIVNSVELLGALPDNTLILYTSGGLLRRSVDGGLHWSAAANIPAGLKNIFFANRHLYSFHPATNELYTTDDAGLTWHALGSLGATISQTLNRVMYGAGKLYIWGNGLYVSADNGITWTHQAFSYQGSPISVLSVRATELGLFAKGANPGVAGRLLYSPDDGVNWLLADFPKLNDASGAYAGTGTTIFAVDSMGTLWKNENFNTAFFQAEGYCYLDGNNNGVQDSGEVELSNIVVRASQQGVLTRTDTSGNFSLAFQAHPDTIRAVPPLPYASVNPPAYGVSSSTGNLPFGIYFPPGIHDLRLNLTHVHVFRTGFETEVVATCHNLGTEPTDGVFTFKFNPALQAAVASVPAPVATTDSSLTWNVTSLLPLRDASFKITMQTLPSTPLGTLITLKGEVVVDNDQHPANNTAVISTAVFNAFDPNNKTVSPALFTVDNLQAQEPLIYTIRFQNTGNYPASRVVVRDTLSANLSAGDLQVLGASHPFSWSIRGAGILEFVFDNLYLPDSLTDELGSHGFITFSVPPKNTLSIGDMVVNTAHIYFDFNDAIHTNLVETTVQNVVATISPSAVLPLEIIPNPATKVVRIQWPDALETDHLVRVFDERGRLVKEVTAAPALEMSVEQFPAGVYWVICTSRNGVYAGKLIVIKS